VTQTSNANRHVLDAIVIGAGFAGLYMLHALRQRGFDAQILEAASDVGGTWFWNRYPGARCDIPSVEYSYSFSPELERDWHWTERYAGQPEIQRYLGHVADRFDLRRDIQFETRVEAAVWDDVGCHWNLQTSRGPTQARFLILGTGNLSVPKLPDWPGMERFEGEVLHTATWPKDANLQGKRIGLVGTGSSGIQAIPELARMAASLTVFQRTPSFVVPANNAPLTLQEREELEPRLPALREEARNSPFGFFQQVIGQGPAKAADPVARTKVLEESWNAGPAGLLLSYGDLLFDAESNAVAAEFARGKIAELVKDARTAQRLTPHDYPIGARRLVSEIGFFDAMNRPNVRLVDVREEPVVEVTARGVVTSHASYDLDAIVFATGFHAMTGAAKAIHIVGREGRTLRDEWADGPRSYLGLSVAGFPNLFTITGPGSPSVLSNVVLSIEQHVEWITSCLEDLRARGARQIEATPEAESDWMTQVDAIAQHTLFPKANSWYQGRTRDGRFVFMPYVGGVGAYRATCATIARNGYEGFTISGQSQPDEQVA
jgi:cyclohexanone monooxygenase